MTFKKFRGQIFGVELTAKEQKAVDAEIKRQVIEDHQRFMNDFDYMILWVLYNRFDFDLQQLRMAYDLFRADNDALIKHYEMDDAGIYIARKEMNAIGCNVEQWNKEGSE